VEQPIFLRETSIDFIVSPYELHDLLKPSDDPTVKTEDVEIKE